MVLRPPKLRDRIVSQAQIRGRKKFTLHFPIIPFINLKWKKLGTASHMSSTFYQIEKNLFKARSQQVKKGERNFSSVKIHLESGGCKKGKDLKGPPPVRNKTIWSKKTHQISNTIEGKFNSWKWTKIPVPERSGSLKFPFQQSNDQTAETTQACFQIYTLYMYILLNHNIKSESL